MLTRALVICRRYQADCIALLCAVLAVWWILSQANCVGYHDQANHYNFYEQQAVYFVCFGRGPIAALGRFWLFIDRYHEPIFAAITTLATIAIAVFTATIWDVNRTQLSHGREVERAYVSGGGNRNQVFFSLSSQGTPIYQPGPDFVFRVNNYGKTSATIYKLSYGFCDESAIPQEPTYTIQYRRNQIDPGKSGQEIAQHRIPSQHQRPVVFGRFHYRTIFDTYYSSGFIYLVIAGQASEPIRPPSDAYIEDRDEKPEDDDAR